MDPYGISGGRSRDSHSMNHENGDTQELHFTSDPFIGYNKTDSVIHRTEVRQNGNGTGLLYRRLSSASSSIRLAVGRKIRRF